MAALRRAPAARFADRAEAGRLLAERLVERLAGPGAPAAGGAPDLVLGLPRGGVVVAAPVARALGAPLDVVLVGKVGAPWQPELALGAVGEGGVRVLGGPALPAVPEAALEALCRAAEAEVARRAARWREVRRAQDPAGRRVVVVDDGVATGSTARAALAVLRARGAAGVVLAAPVAVREVAEALRGEVDELVLLEEPVRLRSVGAWYRDFRQVEDDEVAALLAAQP